MREITLNMAATEPYEIGAAATVLMCWPGEADEAKRAEQHVRLCAWAVRKLVADEPGGELRPWPIKPVYAFSSGAFRLDAIERRRDLRLRMGYLAMPFLKTAALGANETFKGMSGLSVAALIDWIGDVEPGLGREVDGANFRQREWRPSLPVIHLAAAARVLMRQDDENGRERSWAPFILERDRVEAWLRLAMEIEPFALQAFPEIEAAQLRIRLA